VTQDKYLDDLNIDLTTMSPRVLMSAIIITVSMTTGATNTQGERGIESKTNKQIV